MYQKWLSQPPTAGPYSVSKNGPVRMVTGACAAWLCRTAADAYCCRQAAAAAPAFSMVAVAPNRAELAGISADGQTVFTGALGADTVLTPKRPGGTRTS